MLLIANIIQSSSPFRLTLISSSKWRHWSCQNILPTGNPSKRYRRPCERTSLTYYGLCAILHFFLYIFLITNIIQSIHHLDWHLSVNGDIGSIKTYSSHRKPINSFPGGVLSPHAVSSGGNDLVVELWWNKGRLLMLLGVFLLFFLSLFPCFFGFSFDGFPGLFLPRLGAWVIFVWIRFPQSWVFCFVLKASPLFHVFFVPTSLLLTNQLLPTDSPTVTLTTIAIPSPEQRPSRIGKTFNNSNPCWPFAITCCASRTGAGWRGGSSSSENRRKSKWRRGDEG